MARFSLFFTFLILLMFGNTSTASSDNNVVISGRIVFATDWSATAMDEKHGHKKIKEIPNGNYKTNLFGVSTEIIVKNSKGDIVGLAKTKEGTFSVSVEPSDFYTISFDFLKPHTKTISKDSLSFLDFNFGLLPFETFR